VHLYEPHRPYQPLAGVESSYDAEIVRSDRIVGRLLDDLRERKLYDDALIIFTSDHGEGLGDHGEQQHGVLLYRETLQVPLFVKLPRNRLRGRAVASDAQLIDIAPTILEPDRKSGYRNGGRSLAILAATPTSRTIHAETLYPQYQLGWHPLQSVIANGLHLISGKRVELFDLATDPGERHDLSDSERRRVHPLLRELRDLDAPRPGRARPANADTLEALGYLSGGTAKPGQSYEPEPRDRIGIVDDALRLTSHLRKRNYIEALKIADSILVAHPQFAEVWDRKAIALLGLGRTREAEAAAHEALRRAPP
jgi:hypothetical protein